MFKDFYTCPRCGTPMAGEKTRYFVCPGCGRALCEEQDLKEYTDNSCGNCGTFIGSTREKALALLEDTFEIASEEIAKLADKPLTTEEKKAVEKMSWGMHCNPETKEVKIFPMNGNQIIIHGKEEAQFFTDHLLDCFQTE